jgi:hypothetical protein
MFPFHHVFQEVVFLSNQEVENNIFWVLPFCWS